MSINYFRSLKKQQPIDNRPKYLRYGDVFISPKSNNFNKQQQRYSPNFSTATMQRNNSRISSSNINNNKYKTFDAANIDRIRTTNRINSDIDDMQINPDTEGIQNINNQYDYDNIDYLQTNNNRFNRQMYEDDGRVNYMKRQLPPLQQKYSPRNSQYDLQYDNKYWDDYDPYQPTKSNRKQENNLSFKFIWQKFIITFTSILSIVCIAWIAYHWNSNKSYDGSKNGNTPEIIEPDKPSFKVLPDVPGGIDIPYQDKSIYNRVDPNFKQKTKEIVRTPQDVPAEIPTVSNSKTSIEEYSIVDEKDYYVKCPIDGDKNVALKQLNLFKKKLSTFPDGDMLEGTTCAIRTVENTSGKRGRFILIGPFCDDNTAKQIGHFCKIKGEIISVKKANKN